MTPESGLKIHVSGIVQGVGFRPFIYNLARSLDLRGWVSNTTSGVEIEIEGSTAAVNTFMDYLTKNPPLLARIDTITTLEKTVEHFREFEILSSQPIPGKFIPVSPDVSICPDCRKELFDPKDRRYRYPFINCTNCGPRFSIIKDIPYDRPNTTMSSFELCPDCSREYNDPTNRRFHAQPIACPTCGPRVEFCINGESALYGEVAIKSARNALQNGKILAVKGLGGYHLACDAMNPVAVDELHRRKKRSDKPFALMAFGIETLRKYVEISIEEEKLLNSPQHPIVLLKMGIFPNDLTHTAPQQRHLGFMLPYTPLHLLLMEIEEGFPDVLVMTSGNLSEEPIAFTDEEAKDKFATIADGILSHDRPIQIRVDDSVVRVHEKKVYPIRRSRGYAPDPLQFGNVLPQVLACGAELKNTFSLSRDRYVFVSHHIGDMENYETYQSFEAGISHYKNLFKIKPQSVAVDMHPDYLSTSYGTAYASENDLKLYQVQHHHAHLASCLADNDWKTSDSVIGLIFDGTGFGTDGSIWGGEVLIGGYRNFHRRFHLQEALLPGGDSAIRNPAKIALAYLFSASVEWNSSLLPISVYSARDLNILLSQLKTRINTPVTTSMGRLFDAVSSLLGIRHQVTYEGQAAIELENCQDPDETGVYDLQINEHTIESLPLLAQIIKDYQNHIPVQVISSRFHNTIAGACLDCCRLIRDENGIETVALSGGVWQNMTLLQKTTDLLRKHGFRVLLHHQVPPNDGGISLGQILVVAAAENKI